jgi:cellobiose phosphorylase
MRKDGTSAQGYTETKTDDGLEPNKDQQVWLTAAVAAYVKETGDTGILFEKIPYFKDGAQCLNREGTLYEHLWKNLDHCFKVTGENGLPRTGLRDKEQSIWLAQALVRSLKILAELSEQADMKDEAIELRRRAQLMSGRVEKYWDGNWYARGITGGGFVYGSSKNKEGKIYLDTQSWALMAGIPDPKKRKKILASVDRYLDGEHGYAHLYPAYSKCDERLGPISRLSKGARENASVFCPAATSMIVADLIVGRGDKAYESIKKIMPSSQKNHKVYKAEPYAYAEYLTGPAHAQGYGEGESAWVTGIAAWTFLAALEHMLGVARDYKGLKIDPCITKKWRSFKVIRPFRGNIYEVDIENPEGVERGVKEVYLNETKIEGNVIPIDNQGKYHKVRVVMGGAA